MRRLTVVPVAFSLQACVDSEPSDHDEHPTQLDDTGDSGGESGDSGGDDGGDDGSGSGEDGGSEDGGDDGGTETFVPDEGEWNFFDGSIVSDSCDYDYDELPSGGDGFTLTGQGGQEFIILLDGATEGISCAWDAKQDFRCDPSSGSEELDDLDATIVSETLMTGNFPDASTMSSFYDITVDCSGGDCGIVEWATGLDLPCTVELELLAESVE